MSLVVIEHWIDYFFMCLNEFSYSGSSIQSTVRIDFFTLVSLLERLWTLAIRFLELKVLIEPIGAWRCFNRRLFFLFCVKVGSQMSVYRQICLFTWLNFVSSLSPGRFWAVKPLIILCILWHKLSLDTWFQYFVLQYFWAIGRESHCFISVHMRWISIIILDWHCLGTVHFYITSLLDGGFS